jgi:hypothetical protein
MRYLSPRISRFISFHVTRHVALNAFSAEDGNQSALQWELQPLRHPRLATDCRDDLAGPAFKELLTPMVRCRLVQKVQSYLEIRLPAVAIGMRAIVIA